MTVRDQLTKRIIGCCFDVHRQLGPGFSERICHNALKLQFEQQGLGYQTEKEFEVFYLNKKIRTFRVDLLVEDQVIIEIKSVAGNIPVLFQNQLRSYLKASGLHVGLLINFGDKSCQVKRVVV